MNTVKMSSPKLRSHPLGHSHKTSMNAGLLYPTMFQECIPNDRIRCGQKAVVRLAPLVAPMMHEVRMYSHTFFVPNRLVWDNWEDFITEPQTDIAHPYVDITTANWSILLSYFGIPKPEPGQTCRINPIVMAAYALIYDEYYRDENLQPKQFVPLVNGDNTTGFAAWCEILTRAWERDYFTSALPFAQKGQPVELPIGVFEDVPVMRNRDDVNNFVIDGEVSGAPAQTAVPQEESDNTAVQPDFLYAKTSLSQVLSATINDLRIAKSIQELLEKLARAGSRYTEYLKAIFGAWPKDERLQRPEYITGAVTNVTISAIPNTTGTEAAPQGTLAGQGTAILDSRYGRYHVKEHGYLITITSIRPKTLYSQGLNRTFIKTTPLDYYTPQLAHVGEEAILNKEVHAYHTQPDGTFGYTPRYSYLRTNLDRVSGEFADVVSSLNPWTWRRNLPTDVALSSDFIKCQPDYTPFAVTDDNYDHFYCDIYNDIRALRPIPKYGTPTF